MEQRPRDNEREERIRMEIVFERIYAEVGLARVAS